MAEIGRVGVHTQPALELDPEKTNPRTHYHIRCGQTREQSARSEVGQNYVIYLKNLLRRHYFFHSHSYVTVHNTPNTQNEKVIQFVSSIIRYAKEIDKKKI